ncbi:hypothetical protein J2736_001205 [Paenibacillus qinlingensis]|uniref:Uncharacterized protein n=1 Tax=Paenibacillus qinlingensis TaxID=1837343 RepID=A0ABU1NSN4_9BACL|nr:hypothetical protein [Paenibacillus qinlingensis]
MANSKRYTFRAVTEQDQALIDEFLIKHQYIDFPSFIRAVVIDAIASYKYDRLEHLLRVINDHQREHGAPEI